MLGMAIILTASLIIGWLLVEQFPSSPDTFSYYDEDGQVVEVHFHNVITYEVMYSQRWALSFCLFWFSLIITGGVLLMSECLEA